jgi:DNA gyrase/topoisomerase IV subunit A
LGSDHNIAIKSLKDILGNEFGVEVFADIRDNTMKYKSGYYGKSAYSKINFNGRIPDLFLIKNDKSIIVVEVGSTEAEKIVEYCDNSDIVEIRWYTRKCILAASWKRSNGAWINSDNLSEETIRCQKVLESLNSGINNLELQKNKLDKQSKKLSQKIKVKLKNLGQITKDFKKFKDGLIAEIRKEFKDKAETTVADSTSHDKTSCKVFPGRAEVIKTVFSEYNKKDNCA